MRFSSSIQRIESAPPGVVPVFMMTHLSIPAMRKESRQGGMQCFFFFVRNFYRKHAGKLESPHKSGILGAESSVR